MLLALMLSIIDGDTTYITACFIIIAVLDVLFLYMYKNKKYIVEKINDKTYRVKFLTYTCYNTIIIKGAEYHVPTRCRRRGEKIIIKQPS